MAKTDGKTSSRVPRLRFPEFQDEPLREFVLGDVTEDCTERLGKGNESAPIMGVSKTDGIVPMEERLIAKDTARYKCLEKDWFAYNPMRLNIGSIARWQGDHDVLVSPDYVVFRCVTDSEPSIDPAYLDHFRTSDQWENFVTQSGDGGVRIRIYYKDLAKLSLTLPSPAEQRKIAECLTSLDALVAARGRKLAALAAHKKGLMQQLFPRPGESLPRLRFPEFREEGEWEEKKLGDLVEINSGNSPSTYELLEIGTFPFVKVEDLNNCVKYQLEAREYSDDTDGVVETDSLIFPKRGAAIALNKIRISARPILMDTNMMALTLHEGGDAEFLYYCLSHIGLDAIADSSTIPQINNKHIIPFKLQLPSPAEQQRIAACLGSLDAALAAEAQALSALRTHKKGLMQQLFPSPEGDY